MLLNASLATTILVFTSFPHLPSCVIMLPMHGTCIALYASIVAHVPIFTARQHNLNLLAIQKAVLAIVNPPARPPSVRLSHVGILSI